MLTGQRRPISSKCWPRLAVFDHTRTSPNCDLLEPSLATLWPKSDKFVRSCPAPYIFIHQVLRTFRDPPPEGNGGGDETLESCSKHVFRCAGFWTDALRIPENYSNMAPNICL